MRKKTFPEEQIVLRGGSPTIGSRETWRFQEIKLPQCNRP